MAGSSPLGDGRPAWGCESDGPSRIMPSPCLAGAPRGISGDGLPPRPSASTSASKKHCTLHSSPPRSRCAAQQLLREQLPQQPPLLLPLVRFIAGDGEAGRVGGGRWAVVEMEETEASLPVLDAAELSLGVSTGDYAASRIADTRPATAS
ncbi:unnamed protein product [Urochloa humidicola]